MSDVFNPTPDSSLNIQSCNNCHSELIACVNSGTESSRHCRYFLFNYRYILLDLNKIPHPWPFLMPNPASSYTAGSIARDVRRATWFRYARYWPLFYVATVGVTSISSLIGVAAGSDRWQLSDKIMMWSNDWLHEGRYCRGSSSVSRMPSSRPACTKANTNRANYILACVAVAHRIMKCKLTPQPRPELTINATINT